MKPHEHNTAPHPTSPPKPQAGRFLYASGESPLAGYTIHRGVGQGGFGEIYYATSDAGKDVALKLIRRNLDVELRGIRQCLNLKHPNLIDLYDIRQDAHGDTWVIMEYVAEASLEAVLADCPSGLPPAEALGWIAGVGAGVAYLHERGIVHRDLKPGNIFRDEGIVKVGDYGLSKFISCSRRSGQTESVGTVHYMAPEVANGRYGRELDVYALGVILYELLTGRVPFEGESVGEVLMKHLTAQPDVSMIAEPYRSVIAKAMEKDPELRYRSAAEMMAALSLPLQQTGDVRFAADSAPAKMDCLGADGTSANVGVRTAVPAAAKQSPWPRFGEKPLPAMLVASPRERLAELLGSMLTGSLAVAAMSVVMVLIESYWTGAANAPRPEQFAWLLSVSLAGTWAVLILSKFWEASPRGDPMLRRFFQMVVGLAIGAAAYALAEVFFVHLPAEAGYPKALDYRLPPNFYALDGQPLLMAHAACFGTLFLLMRWWRQADPTRHARLSVWSVTLSVLTAGLVAQVWQFPQPWLPMVAAAMSVAVQLSAPWRRTTRRKW